jgi:hypothetical protein
MKLIFIISLILITGCSYFKKNQLHTYNLRYSNNVGNSFYQEVEYFKLTERTKDWLIFENYFEVNDTLFISDKKLLNGSLKDFRPNQSHKIKFSGRIIDESCKTLRIKGEYFVKTPVSNEFKYAGVLEIF